MSNNFNSAGNVLRLSSKVLALGAILLRVGLYGAYFYDGALAIRTLVSMHAMVILGPSLLKVGYVMRLVAQRQSSHSNGSLASAVA